MNAFPKHLKFRSVSHNDSQFKKSIRKAQPSNATLAGTQQVDRIWDRIKRFMSKDRNTKKNGLIDHAATWQTLHQLIFRRWAGEALLEKLGLEARSAQE